MPVTSNTPQTQSVPEASAIPNESTVASEPSESAAEQQITQSISDFKAFLDATAKNLLKAAHKYAETIKAFGETAESAFRKAFPDVSEHTWDVMQRVGNDDLTVRALTCPSNLAVTLVSSLPLNTQVILLGDATNEPVKQKVYVRGKTVEKYTRDMSGSELYSLIDTRNKRIRSIREQKELHPVHTALTYKVVHSGPYSVEGDSLVISRSCIIGKNELLGIARKLGVLRGAS